MLALYAFVSLFVSFCLHFSLDRVIKAAMLLLPFIIGSKVFNSAKSNKSYQKRQATTDSISGSLILSGTHRQIWPILKQSLILNNG